MTKSSDGVNSAIKEISSLLVGRFITPMQLDSIKNSLKRGELDPMTHAAAGGLALAISILEDNLGGDRQGR